MKNLGNPVDSNEGNTGIRKRIREHYRRIYKRDKELVRSIDIRQLNRWLMFSLSLLSVLFLLDVISTLVAINGMPGFIELNVIVAPLFDRGFEGFLLALALKYYLLLPVAVVISLKPYGTKFDVVVRVAKLGVLTGLIAGNLLYTFIVMHNAALLLGL